MIDEDDIPDDVKRDVETMVYGRPLTRASVATTRRHSPDQRRGESRKDYLTRKKLEADPPAVT